MTESKRRLLRRAPWTVLAVVVAALWWASTTDDAGTAAEVSGVRLNRWVSVEFDGGDWPAALERLGRVLECRIVCPLPPEDSAAEPLLMRDVQVRSVLDEVGRRLNCAWQVSGLTVIFRPLDEAALADRMSRWCPVRTHSRLHSLLMTQRILETFSAEQRALLGRGGQVPTKDLSEKQKDAVLEIVDRFCRGTPRAEIIRRYWDESHVTILGWAMVNIYPPGAPVGREEHSVTLSLKPSHIAQYPQKDVTE